MHELTLKDVVGECRLLGLGMVWCNTVSLFFVVFFNVLKDKVFISFLGCIKKLFIGFTFGLPNVKAAYIEALVNWLIGGFMLMLPLEFLLCTGPTEQHIKTLCDHQGASVGRVRQLNFLYDVTRPCFKIYSISYLSLFLNQY